MGADPFLLALHPPGAALDRDAVWRWAGGGGVGFLYSGVHWQGGDPGFHHRPEIAAC